LPVSCIGAGAGLLLADAFDANPAWTVGTALAGAAIGQQVARNNSTGECAYYQGRNSAGQAVYRVGSLLTGQKGGQDQECGKLGQLLGRAQHVTGLPADLIARQSAPMRH
jgi:hypothetical protein